MSDRMDLAEPAVATGTAAQAPPLASSVGRAAGRPARNVG